MAALLLALCVLAGQVADAKDGRGDFIDVTVRGTLRTGVMAIGAETTGATITADGITWELELTDVQRKAAERLNGRKVTVSGSLRHQGGVEVKTRAIVKVRRLSGKESR